MPFPRVSCFYTSLNGDNLTSPPIIDPVGRSSILQARAAAQFSMGWGPTWARAPVPSSPRPLQVQMEREGAGHPRSVKLPNAQLHNQPALFVLPAPGKHQPQFLLGRVQVLCEPQYFTSFDHLGFALT